MESKFVELELSSKIDKINVFPEEIWTDTFLDSIVKLLRGGYGREIYQSLQLLESLTRNESELKCSSELFSTLSLILLQRNTLTVENEQRNWAYLILKNGEQKVDHGISRLINSFLYSSRKQTILTISLNALRIIRNFIGVTDGCEEDLKVKLLLMTFFFVSICIN
jgi:hypothetical protein